MIIYSDFVNNKFDNIDNSLTITDIISIVKDYINSDNKTNTFTGLYDLLNVKTDNNTNKLKIYININLNNIHIYNDFDSYYYTYPYNTGNCVDKFVNNILCSKTFDIKYMADKLAHIKRDTIDNYIGSSIYENDFTVIRNIMYKSKRIMDLCQNMLEHISDNSIK